MPKLRYSGDTGHFANATVKELKDYAKKIGIKNRSKFKTRFQLIEAIEGFLNNNDNIVYISVKNIKP